MLHLSPRRSQRAGCRRLRISLHSKGPSYCRHWRRRPSKVVYVPDTGSNERNCVQPAGPIARFARIKLSSPWEEPELLQLDQLIQYAGCRSRKARRPIALLQPDSQAPEVWFSSLRTGFSSGPRGLVSAGGFLPRQTEFFVRRRYNFSTCGLEIIQWLSRDYLDVR